ncbi:hypothetical protein [Bradyrhizobium iriomotense]|uniref:Uncharacterized protein n=1 Tax=Bradyrhizobium iriomotense TaxID=441950 RepID=A0ABQ6AY11_9BRAD|nr:hypothetical protein [Bradyrhizobium iriomotense]GLR84773.1 hypothetical protein GCM10007857_14830 [Bradyrhizobium iriomotense]
MSENYYDAQLEELKQRSVDRLLSADVFDLPAFQALHAHLWHKARGLKNEYVISKQILACIRSAATAIESRAEYLSSVREHVHLAGDFHAMLDRLIAGEIEGDRTAGIPRII